MIIRDDVGLSFDDVLLVPKQGVLAKRAVADISSEVVKGVNVYIPIISAPMTSVTEFPMAYAMSNAGGFGIIHRFMSIDEQVVQYKRATDYHQPEFALRGNAGVAIGINEGYERWERLAEAGCTVFCLDVAHAHHQTVARFLTKRPYSLNHTKVIAGNVATAEGARYLAEAGIDAIKVGIGPGAACSTREVTGFGVPQLIAINDVAWVIRNSYSHIRIIADGGIKNSGDIVKALAAGADTVMLGRLLAGALESPEPGQYWGMASKRVNGHHAPEGIEGVVPVTGHVKQTLASLAWGIKSGVSYGGGINIHDLRQNAEFIRVSALGKVESGTRL